MNATIKPSKLRSEDDVIKSLNLVKPAEAKALSAADHKRIADAAKTASLSLRKQNPKAANALYYVHYKHSGAAKRRASAFTKAHKNGSRKTTRK